MTSMTTYLWGASGAVGQFVLPLLAPAPGRLLAYSRRPQNAQMPTVAQAGVEWRCADLSQQELRLNDRDSNVLICAGPLDHFTRLMGRTALPAGTRILALSSLSARWKAGSPNVADARLAARLLDAEAELVSRCEAMAATACILRCGLVYGAGVDRTLTPLRRIASRWRMLPWPRGARGLRQPVHADDIARALAHAAQAKVPLHGVFELPGPERLSWPVMLQRVLQTTPTPSRLCLLPDFALERILRALTRRGEPWASKLSMLQRVYEDQVTAVDDWYRFGVIPRAFSPTPADFSFDGASIKSMA